MKPFICTVCQHMFMEDVYKVKDDSCPYCGNAGVRLAHIVLNTTYVCDHTILVNLLGGSFFYVKEGTPEYEVVLKIRNWDVITFDYGIVCSSVISDVCNIVIHLTYEVKE